MLKKADLSKPVLLICVLLVMIICGATTLYGDDFIYATYFYDGIGGFFKRTIEHYMQMNGRAFIHFVLELVLIFKDRLFFAVIPAMLLGVFISFRDNNKNLAMYLGLCFMGTMLMPVKILREGMLWMSGAANYIFPVIFAVSGYFAFIRLIGEKKISIFYIIFFFLCGQTTEQCAVIIISGIAVYVLFGNLKKLSKSNIIYLCCIVTGFLVVVLSPGTSSRIGAETAQKLPLFKSFDNLYTMVFENIGIMWIFIASLIALASSEKKIMKIVLGTSVVVLIMSLFGFYSAAGWIFVFAALMTVFLLIAKRKKCEYCILFLSALLSVAMLVFSTSYGYRNLMPAILIMMGITASALSEITEDIFKRNMILVVCFVISAAVFTPKIAGYISNRSIINDNISAVKTGDKDVYYNVDLNNTYAYNQFFTDSFYEEGYRRIYKVDDNTKIHLKGKDFRDFHCGNVFCERPAYEKNGTLYYPLRDTAEAYGGKISYDETKKITLVTINNVNVEFDKENGMIIKEKTIYNADDYILKDYQYGNFFNSHTYISGKGLEDLFDIKIEKAE
ncbi:MAG: DUF6056 family protein [Clostridia bacterium]|nr:DUF6056 family protein [Clostridia bacterium]